MTGEDETDPNARESADVTPAEAAMLAGMIASPSLYDPVENPRAPPPGATWCWRACSSRA